MHIGSAVANPKEGKTMKKLTTKVMIATAALVVVAGVASAQVMTASIPFEFRAGNQVMAPGTYQVDRLAAQSGIPIYRLLGVDSHRSIALLAQARVDPEKGWAAGNPKLLFACASGSCALAELWSGSESNAYKFRGPKTDTDQTAVLREIPLRPGKGE
jgi:hypothetical protein